MEFAITLFFGMAPALLVLGYLIYKSQAESKTLQAVPASAAEGEAAPANPRLTLRGTRSDRQPWLNDSMLKGHAVPPQMVRDLAWYELTPRPRLPEDVSECLSRCYRDGLARGTKVRDLVVSGKGKAGDKLVFALLSAGGTPHIVAWVA